MENCGSGERSLRPYVAKHPSISEDAGMTYRVVGTVRLGTLSGRKRNWQFLLAEPGSGFFIGHFKQKEHAMPFSFVEMTVPASTESRPC